MLEGQREGGGSLRVQILECMGCTLAWVPREFIIIGRKEAQWAGDNGGGGRLESFPGVQKLLVPFVATPNIAGCCSPL